jgi:hypothetical protein
VNPDHLFLGTTQDNTADMVAKGRANRGVEQRDAKLNEERVREIRASNESGPTLAKRYGVDRSIINEIRRRELWRHVR